MVDRVWARFNQLTNAFHRHSLRGLLTIALLLPVVSGCTQIQSLFQWSEADLKIQVTDTDTPGLYIIRGSTNLPEDTQISVAAVRYLQLESLDRTATPLNPNPTYSILAYAPATVKQGEWQTQLNLWQVAADGNYRESWQIEQNQLGLSLQPDETVIFLATLTPIDELSALEQELAKRGIRLAQGSVLSTSDGFRYAQVQQALAVALPTGQTNPNPEDDNFGWGDRYLIPQEPQNPTNLEFPEERLTDAPAKPEEALQ